MRLKSTKRQFSRRAPRRRTGPGIGQGLRSRAQKEFAREVRAGLTDARPWLASKWFYDARGARLFDRITELPEYYPTRAEEALLDRIAVEIAAWARPRELVEIGSGASRKIAILLGAVRAAGGGERCVLFDLNTRAVAASARHLRAEFPGLRVDRVPGDFTRDLARLGRAPGRLVAFLGGTIGNLHPGQVRPFLAAVADTLEPGGFFLLGVDLVKNRARLEAAYDDAAGVTAEFNRNLLRVVNRRLGADFDPDAFDHVAFYDPRRAWIEMRLRARRALRVRVPGARLALRFAAGDEIRTEVSCKFTRASLERRLPGTGLGLARFFTDWDRLFALALLERRGTVTAAARRRWRGPGGPWGASPDEVARSTPRSSGARPGSSLRPR